jgi:hypothetical protein
MREQPQIGVIGSGRVGKALGSWIVKAGFSVVFTSRDLAHAGEAASAAGQNARALPLEEALQESEIVLLTLPYKGVGALLESGSALLRGKIVVDVTNPVSDDRKSLLIGHDTSGAEEIAKKIPEAKVVKAFNTVFAEVYSSQDPVIYGHAISICFAGDDATAKEAIKTIIEKLGFDAVDAGPLKNARYLEPLSFLNIQLGRMLGYGTRIGFSLLRGTNSPRGRDT